MNIKSEFFLLPFNDIFDKYSGMNSDQIIYVML